jgi:hypothetical protein
MDLGHWSLTAKREFVQGVAKQAKDHQNEIIKEIKAKRKFM